MSKKTPIFTKGYKQTEIGVIPSDWNISPIEDLVDVIGGGTPSTQISAYWNGDINWFTPTEIGNDKYVYSSKRKITHAGLQNSGAKMLNEGTILMTSRAGIGDLAILKKKGATNQGFQSLTPRVDVCGEFLYYLMLTKRSALLEKASGSTFLEISPSNVRSLLVQKPSLPEQVAIANVLSDTDALIEKLTKLLEKKRNIKEGAMQELLTGKRRLPGFNGKWKFINMGKKSILKARIGWQGLTTAEYLDTGDYYLVTGTDFTKGDIKWESCHFVDRTRYKQDKNIQLALGDVLITKDGTIGKVGFVNSLPLPATLNSGVFVVRPKAGEYEPLFLYFILTSHIFDEFLERLQAGSTISHLYQKDFINFTFQVPDIEEQVAIALVLKEMDNEIKLLDMKLSKYRQLKQGMMQTLLTGKIRLI